MRRNVIFGLASVAMALAVGSGPALARDLPAGGMTIREVAAWLQDKGYKAKIEANGSADTGEIISSAAQGVNFDIYMYGCSGQRCTSLQYAAGWNKPAGATPETINNWDRDKRYIRAYLDKNDNAFGEYDVDLSPGGTYELLDHSLERFEDMILQFKTFINE